MSETTEGAAALEMDDAAEAPEPEEVEAQPAGEAAAELDPADIEIPDLIPEKLTGEIRDFILGRLRDLQEKDRRPWHLRSDDDQRRTISAAEYIARQAVRAAVEAVARREFPYVPVAIEGIAVKGIVKASIALIGADADQKHRLIDRQGAKAILVLADPDEFDEADPHPINREQPDLL